MIQHLEKDYLQLQIENSGYSFDTPWGDLMESAITSWFAEHIPDKGARILDYACGEGRGLLALRNMGFINVTGIDVNPEKVQRCAELGLNAVLGDIYSLLDREFDYVFTSHTLEHVPSIRDALYILNSITRHKIFYIIPVRESPEFVKRCNPSHISSINSPAEMTDIIESLGLKHVSTELTRLCPELWGIITCNYVRSNLRVNCDKFVISCANHFLERSTLNKRMLYVGTAGDPIGGEYSAYFPGFKKFTFDIDKKWNPDIVGDICNTEFEDESWDLIICSNVIEHVPMIFDMAREIERILKIDGYLLIDCPWSYPYHAEPPSFGDYWRVSLDGLSALFTLKPINKIQTDISSHILFQKV